MDRLELLQWMASVTGLLFVFALGAIVGSFVNVVAYRVPMGLSLIRPGSRCPSCETPLTWRENFPIFGWIALGGKCRFCKSRISAEYPLVEFVTAVLFALPYAIWYMRPSVLGWALDVAWWTPEWALDGLVRTWPMYFLILVMMGCLIAITLVDAKTFQIPISIPWGMAGIALVVHPAHALWLSTTKAGGLKHSVFDWTIPTFDGAWLGAALGAGVGLVLAAVLLWMKVLPQSFSDYEAWEKEATAALERAEAEGKATEDEGESVGGLLARTFFLTAPAVAGMWGGYGIGLSMGQEMLGLGVGTVLGLVVGVVLRATVGGRSGSEGDPVWVGYPHARREMMKEILFLLPVVAGAAGGWILGDSMGVLGDPPLWLLALGGSVGGIIVGGGLVWAVRILGSLAFGKEAMGLGDVHLMAGVGAVVGVVDPVLAFFVAPFLGIAWAVGSVFFGKMFKREGTALPYGPHLATATIIVLLAKPAFEVVLSALAGRQIWLV
ncbi:MAG: prepilin peptidase [Phycisphaerales bacterium]|nr:prepilin peptidase [Phycisphaerales bacterium]